MPGKGAAAFFTGKLAKPRSPAFLSALVSPDAAYALVEAGDPEAIDVYCPSRTRSARSRTAFGMSRNGEGCCALRNSSSRVPRIH